ncbi:MAG: O-antigen ligase family protein [Blastocatellia bacterium]|nr:O-antigen ligase family protein [Blastocatellia bacterium]
MEELTDNDASRFGTLLFVTVLATAMIATLAYGAVDMWAIALLSVLSTVIVILWALDARKTSTFRLTLSPLLIPVAGLVLLGIIQLLPLGGVPPATELLRENASRALTLDPFATRIFVARAFLLLVFLAASLTFINTTSRIKIAVIALIGFGSLMGFFGIIQRLAVPDAIYGLRLSPQAIPFGSYINQHHFAALMEMTAGLVFGVIFAADVKKDKLPLLGLAALMMCLAVIFTGSRGGMISLIAVVAFVAAVSFSLRKKVNREGANVAADRKRRLGIVAVAAAAVFGLIGMVAFLGAGDHFLRGIGVSESYTDPTSGRSHYWTVAGKIFMANPVVGAGLDAFGVAYPEHDDRMGLFRVEQAHNDYLQMLADGGIIGFALVAGFIFLLFRKGLGVIADAKDSFGRAAAIGALAGCFGILVHSFFDFPLRTPSNSYVFMLLVVIATTGVATSKSRRSR